MSEWISVKDRLPEEGTQVLTYDSGSKNGAFEYRLDYIVLIWQEEGLTDVPNPIWACGLVDDYNKVTHWMPLPSPPKNEETLQTHH